uniref:Uncharacterized protein n=1 Tax=Lygus hesperus TaxID=30085 RepID=A0A0K8S6K5_LYGHE
MVAFVKVLAEGLSKKWDRLQGVIRRWLRARISFAVEGDFNVHQSSRKKWRSAEGFSDGAALQVGLPQPLSRRDLLGVDIVDQYQYFPSTVPIPRTLITFTISV